MKSFVKLVRFLFTVPGVKFFLSRRICQDPIEKFFGFQCQRGRTHDNPNAHEFLKNTQALRVVNGFCWDVAKGNCWGNKETKLGMKENTPCQKENRRGTEKNHLSSFIVTLPLGYCICTHFSDILDMCVTLRVLCFFAVVFAVIITFHKQ